jgi:uncharacterized membrane protein
MNTKLIIIVKILAVIGITLALYLLWQRYFTPSFKPCSINATVNCDAVISGPVADTLGIPTPLIGLIGYIVILIAAIKKNPKLIFAMSAFGLAFCLYIAYIELIILRVICPVCILCQIDMISVFLISIYLKRKNNGPQADPQA